MDLFGRVILTFIRRACSYPKGLQLFGIMRLTAAIIRPA
jgi:hypothetical protein